MDESPGEEQLYQYTYTAVQYSTNYTALSSGVLYSTLHSVHPVCPLCIPETLILVSFTVLVSIRPAGSRRNALDRPNY